MHFFRKLAAPCLVSLSVLLASASVSNGQTVLGCGLGLRRCSYRVYYRDCETSCWRVYATYLDCKTAQEAVDLLQLSGRDAYQAPVSHK
jgi:hypothetical protein